LGAGIGPPFWNKAYTDNRICKQFVPSPGGVSDVDESRRHRRHLDDLHHFDYLVFVFIHLLMLIILLVINVIVIDEVEAIARPRDHDRADARGLWSGRPVARRGRRPAARLAG
jgi:hypothetical protein